MGKKISQLDAAIELTGLELIPIVQDGVNKSSTVELLLSKTSGELIQIVLTLPDKGVANKIYLVPNESPKANDVYDEYIWNGSWEYLGNKHVVVDMENYVTIDAFNLLEARVKALELAALK